jgi:hypothetical protein
VNDPNQTLWFAFGGNCGDLSVSATPTPPSDYVSGNGAEYVFDAPTGTTISGYSLDRDVSVSFPASTPPPSIVSAGVSETSGATTTDFDCVQVTKPCASNTPAVTRTGLSASKLSVGVSCADSGGCPASSFTQLSTRLMDARVDVDDPTSPKIALVGGSLPGSNGAAGQQTLDVTATDVGGGVRMINLSIDGIFNQTSVAGGSCGQPYTLRAPCPSGLVRTLHLNTATVTAGAHTATITATDAAGNLSAPMRFTFDVSSGGTPPSGGGTAPSNGSPAVEQPTAKSEQSVISSSSRKSVLVEGTLTTSDGTPISGATLDVTALDLGVFNASARSIGTVTTTPTGRFSISIKPNGAQRISVLFKPFPGSLGTAVTSTIVREDLSLSVKRSKSRVKPGGALTLTGALDGAGAAADGTPIEVDAKIGKSWRAVGVVESNSRGSYKWKYRFTRVKQATRFTFRVIVRKNKSWPWPTETSKSVNVLVAR